MIDPKPFCGKQDPRGYLNQPWQEGGSTCACNGHIAIMIEGVSDPSLAQPDPIMVGRVPKLLAQIAGNDVELFIKLPDTPGNPCQDCGGSGFLTSRTCDDCDGSGSFEHGQHTYDCKECDGGGELFTRTHQRSADTKDCINCDGLGTVRRYIDLQAGETTYRFQESYLVLISNLPSPRLWVTQDKYGTARFDFDGGRGILMPCRQ